MYLTLNDLMFTDYVFVYIRLTVEGRFWNETHDAISYVAFLL